MARTPVTIDARPVAGTRDSQPLLPWGGWLPFLQLEVIYAEARLEGDRVLVSGGRRRYQGGTVTEERFQGEADAEALFQELAAAQQQWMEAVQAMQRRMLALMFPWLR